MTEQQQLETLKKQIAEVVTQRNKIKSQIENHILSAQQGFKLLEPLDEQLSELDSSFKSLWDKQDL